MIIKSLVDLYDEMEKKGIVPKENWAYWDVSGILDLDEEGNLLGLIPVAESDRGKLIKKPMLVPQAFLKRTRGILPNFLCDNSTYFVGTEIKKDSVKETAKKFEAARLLHHRVLDDVPSKIAKAILKYFDQFHFDLNHSSDLIKSNLKMISTGNLVFRIDGTYAQDDIFIQNAWRDYMNTTSDGEIRRCSITGKEDVIPEIHLGIKLPGAKPGAALVSFNDESYSSYGFERNGNSAVGGEASFKYVTALNRLLSNKESHTGIGDVQFIYWSKSANKAYQELMGSFFTKSEKSDEIIHNIFEKLRHGQMIDTNIRADEPFFILGLTPNAARISARFFMEDSFGSILSNLQKHNERMKMVKPAYIDFDFIHFYQLIKETMDKKSKEKKPDPSLVGDLLVSVLKNTPYPETLFSNVMLRIQAERGYVTWEKASIIRAFLLKNRNYKNEDLKESLHEESLSIPYNLGRLFSVLEKTQQESVDVELNSTIRDQYFSSASASPARVFPNLIISSNNHLRKLRAQNVGAYIEKDRLICSIIAKLGEKFPKMMNMDQQGEFAIGYYQQQKFFEKKDGNEKEVEVRTVVLNEHSSNQAYNLGRLFSVLEKLQQDSEEEFINTADSQEQSDKKRTSRQLNSTIKDQYFKAACVTPSRVFPNLFMLSSNHFRKLRNKNMGAYVNRDKQIGEIVNLLNGDFPETLDIEQQGSFVIGYYQQRCKFFEKKVENENKDVQPARLNEDNKSKPYIWGRLFSVLEVVQQNSADEELNTTIKDRYFSAAAMSPGRVYSHLLMLSKYHLRKLSRKNYGAYVYFSRLVEALTKSLAGFCPKTLSTAEQGEFMVGYWQQRYAIFEKEINIETEGGNKDE